MESRTYVSKYDPKLFLKIVSYLHRVKLHRDDRNREPPRFDIGDTLLMKQDEGDDLTDCDIEHELVPLDPFLFTGDGNKELDDDNPNDETTKLQENRSTFKNEKFQFKAEVYCDF